MKPYFTNTFFRFLIGFAVIITAAYGVLVVSGCQMPPSSGSELCVAINSLVAHF